MKTGVDVVTVQLGGKLSESSDWVTRWTAERL